MSSDINLRLNAIKALRDLFQATHPHLPYKRDVSLVASTMVINRLPADLIVNMAVMLIALNELKTGNDFKNLPDDMLYNTNKLLDFYESVLRPLPEDNE